MSGLSLSNLSLEIMTYGLDAEVRNRIKGLKQHDRDQQSSSIFCVMNCLVQFCFLLYIATVFSSNATLPRVATIYKPKPHPFVIYGSCKFPGSRPSWYQGVDLLFQAAQNIAPSTTVGCGGGTAKCKIWISDTKA